MSKLFLLAIFTIFVLVFGLVFFFSWRITNQSINRRLDHLKKYSIKEGNLLSLKKKTWRERIMADLVKLSMPKEKWETSPLRFHFLRAGYQSQEVAFIYYGLKTIFCISAFIISLTYFYMGTYDYSISTILLLSVLSAVIAYYLPNLWIHYRIKNRKQQIFNTFPDALDLIRICVTSGLGLDASIARVGKELNISSRALSEEFHQLNLELRAGATRESAFKNLAIRTDVEDIQALVSMLIQSIRFGTSVSESLRIHADGLRSKRKLKAQEVAAKIPAKLSIPMILCIFPALFIVILGPSVIRVFHILQPTIPN